MKNILLIAFSFVSSVSFGFTLNSTTNPNLKGWANPEVKIYFNPANCPNNVNVASLIMDASEVWNNIPNSKIKVSYGGTTTNTGMSFPPVAYCETNIAGIGGDNDSTPGAAAVDGSSGQITRGVLYLNASAGLANIGNFDRTTLKIIMAHEIGHLLGLGHSHSLNALMYYSGSYKVQFRLSQDDIDGMVYLYPQEDLRLESLAGCALVRRPPNDKNNMYLFIFAALVPLLLAFYLRKETHRAV